MSKSIRLVVTGDMERVGLAESLRRTLGCTANVQFRPSLQVRGMTSARLPDPDDAGPIPADVASFARALPTECTIASKPKQPLPDLVIGIDDLELGNVAFPDRVTRWLRRGLEAQVMAHTSHEAERAELRDALRNRCSFHLLAPLAEAYFFGDRSCLVECGVPRSAPVGLRPGVDLESFESVDVPFLDSIAAENESKRSAGLRWWRTECHPKRYLDFLRAAAGATGTYHELTHGREALRVIDWPAVGNGTNSVPLVRALFEDIAHELGLANPIGALCCAVLTWPAPKIRPSQRVLRNL